MTLLFNKLLGVAATAATLLTLPVLSTSAEAHKQGSLCRYQAIDAQGYLRTKVTRCHHLPSRFQKRPKVGFTLYYGSGGYYFSNRRPGSGYGEPMVCFVTFFERSQVSGGADADVEQARLLPRSVAIRRDAPNDRNRIFTYGSPEKTRRTCNYLDNLENDNADNGQDGDNEEDKVCLVTFFERSQVEAGADATVDRAQLLPRSVAQRRDGPDDRNRIFEYGSQQKTSDTCNYLDDLNN